MTIQELKDIKVLGGALTWARTVGIGPLEEAMSIVFSYEQAVCAFGLKMKPCLGVNLGAMKVSWLSSLEEARGFYGSN